MSTDEIGSKIEKLPEHLVPEVIDYFEFLLNKYGMKNLTQAKTKTNSAWTGRAGCQN